MTYKVYLSIGSNIEPESNVKQALKELSDIADIRSVSPVYLTKPVQLEPGAEDFHNLCVEISVNQDPENLKKHLKAIEKLVGRSTSNTVEEFHQSRKVDLDILLYEPSPEGFEPHEQIHQEAFVVYPLSDIFDPNSHENLPDDVNEWKSRCDGNIIKRQINYQWPPEMSASVEVG